MDTNLRTNLIVNYLPQAMTDGELYSMFITIGPLESAHVMKDIKTNYSFGFGFVNFKYPEDAEKAIQLLDGLEVANKRLKVSFARQSSEDIKDTNLYITHLPRHLTFDDLKAIFEPYGNIIQANLLKDKNTGLSRGVAFVRFSTKVEAEKAIKNLNGKTLEGGCEALSVRVAEEHGKQKAAYFAGLNAALEMQRGRGNPRFGNGFRREAVRYQRGRGFFVSYPPLGYGFGRGVMSQERGRGRHRFDPMTSGFSTIRRRGNDSSPQPFLTTTTPEQEPFDPMTSGFSPIRRRGNDSSPRPFLKTIMPEQEPFDPMTFGFRVGF